MNRIREWIRYEPELFSVIVAVVAFSSLLAWVVYRSERERKDWMNYAREHGCVVIDREPDQNYFYSDGKTTIIGTTPGKAAWKCADGSLHLK